MGSPEPSRGEGEPSTLEHVVVSRVAKAAKPPRAQPRNLHCENRKQAPEYA